MFKFLGFVRIYDLEVLLTHGHKVYIKDVNSYSFDWGREYEIKYAYVRHSQPKFPTSSVVAVNVSVRTTHKLVFWWKEGS